MDLKNDKFVLSKGHAAPSLYAALIVKKISKGFNNYVKKHR